MNEKITFAHSIFTDSDYFRIKTIYSNSFVSFGSENQRFSIFQEKALFVFALSPRNGFPSFVVVYDAVLQNFDEILTDFQQFFT